MKIKYVHFCSNGMVIVFDYNGEQIGELQGFIFDVASKLKKHCDKDTQFYYVKGGEHIIDCDFKWWFEKQEVKQ